MTSPFTRQRRLSHEILTEYHHFCNSPPSTAAVVTFFCHYLREVVPKGLSVHYIPVTPDDRDRGQISDRREEILLMTDAGKIFMSGLVSVEHNHHNLARVAGDEAYTNWEKGEFTMVPTIVTADAKEDGKAWRFFTGHSQMIRFFNSRYTRKLWGTDGEFDVIYDAEHVAAFLQEEYNNILWRIRHR